MRVLVSGAGMAGLSAGIALSALGYDVTLVEHADHLRTGGSPIDIRGDALDVARAGDRVGPVGHVLGLAAQAEGLADEVAVRAQPREGGAGLLRLAVDEAGHTRRARKAETLTEFGVVVEFRALPELQANEGSSRRRLLHLAGH